MAEKVLCVRPSCFGYNEDTASTNSFQKRLEGGAGLIQAAALKEFDDAVATLRAAGICVVVIQDTSADDPSGCKTPDSIFPNNCYSTHQLTGSKGETMKCAVLYPMCGLNRRAERLGQAMRTVTERADRVLDLTAHEAEGRFLEGTGSLVLDHQAKICYAAESPRTHPDLVKAWAAELGFEPVIFRARRTKNGELLYHTNVMISVGPSWCICCFAIIPEEEDRQRVRAAMGKSGKRIVEISEEQVDQFCGNVLAVNSTTGATLTVMSETAYNGFTKDQHAIIGPSVVLRIPTIEKTGGGSARCMLAELVF